MAKIFFIYFLMLHFLYGIELSIQSANRTYPNESEIELLKKNLKSKMIIIDDKESARVLEENMILSNLFLKEAGLSKEFKTDIKIYIEGKLADELVRQKEKSIDVSDDVLLSYYKDKKKKFFSKNMVKMQIYMFDDFESALKVYEDFYKKPAALDKYAGENNISKVTQDLMFDNIHPQIKGYLKDVKEENYIVPPQKWAKNFIVVYVEKIDTEYFKPFEEVKEEIKTLLLNDNKNRLKKELVEYYRNKYME